VSDMIDDFRALKSHRQQVRKVFGKPCPICVDTLPKANPSILLPQQMCRIHHFRDPRPELGQADYDSLDDGDDDDLEAYLGDR
jgi:hypothetical protein